MCETFGSSDPTDLASFGEEEDDESVRLKEYFSWWEPRPTVFDFFVFLRFSAKVFGRISCTHLDLLFFCRFDLLCK